MLTQANIAEVEQATERIEAASRSIDSLLNTERARDLLNNPRISSLRNIKSDLRGLMTEIEGLYE